MPDNIEDTFQDGRPVHVSPTGRTTCRRTVRVPTGPTRASHVAAVYLLLGEEFDRDPFLIFRMRGMDREDLLGP